MVFCQSGHSYKWLHFLPHPCEDSNVVHAHSKEAVYLVNTCDHYVPVRRECDIGLAHIYLKMNYSCLNYFFARFD